MARLALGLLATSLMVALATATLTVVVAPSLDLPDTTSCGLLPRRPIRLPSFTPSVRDVCSFDIDCPAAPGECFSRSVCSNGYCQDPEPKALGTPCNDGDITTSNDVCGRDGMCSGIEFTCPSDIVLRPQRTSVVQVNWQAPVPQYHGLTFSVWSSHRSGDSFIPGTETVVYTATTDLPTGRVSVSCNFNVTVIDPCTGVVCNAQAEQCLGLGTCVDGQCVYERKPDAMRCTTLDSGSAGICISGTCRDPCVTVQCSASNFCRQPQCTISGVLGVCSEVPKPNGYYAERDVTCFGGESVCEAPRQYLPRRPPRLPAFTPSTRDVCTFDIECPAAPSECFSAGVCVDGYCQDPQPKAFGTRCDDRNPFTSFDVCSRTGECSGVQLTCPSDITLSPRSSSGAVVNWEIPTVSYNGVPLSLRGSAFPGRNFPIGTTTVTYTAEGNGPLGHTSVSCSFNITLIDPCANVRCDTTPGDCSDTPVCIDGQCRANPFVDGTRCPAGVCVAGQCRNPCNNVQCEEPTSPCLMAVCSYQGVSPVCSFAAKPTGTYSGVPCHQGKEICNSPFRYLPRRLPPLPSFTVFDTTLPTTTMAPTQSTTTRATTTTFATTTTATARTTAAQTSTTTATTTTTRTTTTATTTRTTATTTTQTSTTTTRTTQATTQTTTTTATTTTTTRTTATTATTTTTTTQTTTTTRATTATTTTQTTTAARTTARTSTCVGRTTDAGEACNCGVDCFECLWSNGANVQCLACRNFKYFLEGQCLTTCPSGYNANGALTKQFYKTCDLIASTTASASTTTRSTTTATTTAATTAAATTAAATTTTTRASGSTIETCVGRATSTTGANCTCGTDCHTCSYDLRTRAPVANSCVLCKNARFLFQSNCVASCPANTISSGTGNFGRTCTTRARRSAAVEGEELVEAASGHSGVSSHFPLAVIFASVGSAIVGLAFITLRRKATSAALDVEEATSAETAETVAAETEPAHV